MTTECDPKSARAELRYSVEHHLRGASLVRVSLVTGLQNQIRVQLSTIGHPIIGDRKYNPSEKLERRITRVALHAARLQFIRPRSGESVCVDCEPPPDFQSLLRAFRVPNPRGSRSSRPAVRSCGAIPEEDTTPPPFRHHGRQGIHPKSFDAWSRNGVVESVIDAPGGLSTIRNLAPNGVRVHQQPAAAGPALPPTVSTAIRLITCRHPQPRRRAHRNRARTDQRRQRRQIKVAAITTRSPGGR